jgi:hypothetical protein
LVAVGLDILLGRRSGVWPAITILLVIGMFAGGAWVVHTAGAVWSGGSSIQEISFPLNDSSRAEIEVTFGVGGLEIGKLADSNELVEGVIGITENETLQQEFYFDEDTAYLHLGSTGTQFYPSWLFNDWEEGFRKWEINLTGAVPIDLEVDTGVGRAVINLDGLELLELNIDSGIGETIVYLPESDGYNAWVSLGVGKLVVYVPSDLNVRIHLGNGLGNTSISGDYIQTGSIYTFSGFDESEDRVELFVDGGIGEVRVVQIQK